jgi:hypothetical protein
MDQFDHVEDDFIAFLADAFGWDDVETAQNAPVLFPSLPIAPPLQDAGAPTPPAASAAALTNSSSAMRPLSTPQQLFNQQAVQPNSVLPFGFAIPDAQESVALSTQILLLQAQHLQHLQRQQHVQQQPAPTARAAAAAKL